MTEHQDKCPECGSMDIRFGSHWYVVSDKEWKNMTDNQDKCPECGSMDIRFGFRNPCMGDYYMCNTCGHGPILFPLNYRRKFIAPIIDSDDANAALKLVRELKHDV